MSTEATPAAPAAAAAPATPAAGAPAPAAAAAAGQGNWYDSFNDDLKGYVQTKGFKGADGVVESYRNFEKLIGTSQDRILKLPTEATAPEWKGIWEKLGVPKDAKEYGLAPAPGADGKFAEWASKAFHEAGLTTAQAKAVAAKWDERQNATLSQRDSDYQAKVQVEESNLKREWGAAHPQNLEIAKRGQQAFGFDGDTIDQLEHVMGYEKTMKLMFNLGAKTGEAQFITGAKNGGGNFGEMQLTPAAARAEINVLKNDQAFVAKYLNRDAEALKKMENLSKMASAGDY